MEAQNRRIIVQAGPGQKARPYLKNNQNKKGAAQAVECLPYKHKDLNSNSSSALPPTHTHKPKTIFRLYGLISLFLIRKNPENNLSAVNENTNVIKIKETTFQSKRLISE
jgi:hypothetical protein